MYGLKTLKQSGVPAHNRAFIPYTQSEIEALIAGYMEVAVPPQNTSRACPCCHHTAKENRQTQANFECVECGYTENADVVGAMNVLTRGRAIVQA